MRSELSSKQPGASSDKNRLHESEQGSLLPVEELQSVNGKTTRVASSGGHDIWKYATIGLTLSLLLLIWVGYWQRSGHSFETGFDTDLEPVRSAIRLRKTSFSSNIIVNDSSQFQLVLDANQARYVGHPTRELDEAWDRLVGNYVALTKPEADRVRGHVSQDGGAYFVVTHARHSLHCVNYLRKVAYEQWYPTIRHENKATVPTFWQHVDHCVEMLRQTILCQSDLTPVPHVWSQEKQMYLADTSLEHTCRDYDLLLQWQDERERAGKMGGAQKA